MESKDIKYINQDFNSLKQELVNYAKTYFPDSYNDFSPSSPGNMFIEMAAYVGDVLSFYQNTQVQETLIQYAKEKENLYTLAYMLGYRPKVTNAATVDVDFYQILPAIISGSSTMPDYNYALVIKEGSQISSNSNSNVSFYVPNKVDFSISSSIDPTNISVYKINTNNNQPEYYLIKKTTKAISGVTKTQSFDFGATKKFTTVSLKDDDIIQITNCIDNDGNIWYEVPYLAQETIFEDVQNTYFNNPNTYLDSSTPYLLKLKNVPRRFVTRFKVDNTLEIQFGAGGFNNNDENIIPNSNNVGIGTIDSLSKLDLAYDPSNFMYSNTYGISPTNTTLTFSYLTGGGISSNVPSNDLTILSLLNTNASDLIGLDQTLLNVAVNSISVNNPSAASGGKGGDSIEDIRLNSIASFPTQLRAVTKEDYIIRALSMPSKYGSISKAYIAQNKNLSDTFSNYPSLNLYVLGLNNSSQLVYSSDNTKENLKTYISQYKSLTDYINIKDAYIININVNFDIMVLPNFTSSEVLVRCVNALKDYFNIEKWSINQPIIMSEIYTLIDQIKGVQTVRKVTINNKVGENLGYSKYGYDILGATKNNIIYPSLDPSIFEVKYPNSDILGRVSNF